jgi:hypothetical protein
VRVTVTGEEFLYLSLTALDEGNVGPEIGSSGYQRA